MTISANSLAFGNFVGAKNQTFSPSADVLQRKILIIGTFDPAKVLVVADVPKQVFSAEDAGDQFGFGSMLHRLVLQAYSGSQGIETWVIPQAEAGGAVVGAGDIDFTGSAGVLAGTLKLYIAGIVVDVFLADADTDDDIATKVAAAITAEKTLPTTGVVNGVTTAQVDFAAKSKGPWGNGIVLSFNEVAGEELPTGVAAVITAMSAGSGIPTILDALNALGTGDDQNGNGFTDLIHGYGQDSTSLNALSTYNGPGNDFLGNYAKEVARPFRSLVGDTDNGTAALTALIAAGNARKLDRTSGIIGVPNSPNHPSEIAALAMGVMARISNVRAEETYLDIVLPGIIPGDVAERWTSDYDNRDLAVKAGISPTTIKNGAVVLQNVVTFYHPDNVPQNSNGYRSQRNISILQNLLASLKANFALEKWQGITIVADTALVGNTVSREKARDVDAVLDDLVALARLFAGNAWLFNSSFTIDELKEGDKVEIRAGGDGFNMNLPVLLSGEGGIFNSEIRFDTNLAIVL